MLVTPTKGDIVLEEPKIVKHGNKYGVKIKAECSVHSYDTGQYFHGDRTDRRRRVSGEDLMEYFDKGKSDPQESIWDINIFGKTLGAACRRRHAVKSAEDDREKPAETAGYYGKDRQ